MGNNSKLNKFSKMFSKQEKKFFAILFVLSVLLLMSKISFSQKGTIEGLVMDKTRNETLTGANVIIQGTNTGTITDFDGKFSLGNLIPGTYNIMVSFISYNTVIVEKVRVEGNKITNLKVELEEVSTALEGVTVAATRKSGTEISMLSSIKSSPLVISGISAQQITRTQDRDASEVIKRIPGVTIIDDRFIVVRGLPQRYNSVWLNNTATPSSEADIKAFSFDVVPSSMIDNLSIFKSPAPELPADFAGGFIKINTKSMPEKNSIIIGFSQSYAQGTTFNNYYMYQGSKTDWLGFDDGTRALPDQMPSHLSVYENSQNPVIREKVTELGRALNENWKLNTTNAIPDTRFSINTNHRFSFGKKSIGTITYLNYSHTRDYNDQSNINYTTYDFVNDNSQFTDKMTDDQYTTTAKVSLMHNWSFFLGNGQKIDFRNLFNQIGWSRSTIRDGIDGYNDSRVYRSYELRYLSRSTFSSQLGGEHSFKQGATVIDWNIGYAYANKKEPDLKRYRQIKSTTEPDQWLMLFSNPGIPDLSSEARYWLVMYERIITGGVNYTQKFAFAGFKPTLKAGFYVEKKNREFGARNFGYAKGSDQSTFGTTTLPAEEVFADENINLTTGIKLMEITSKSDSYTAGNDQLAGYLVLDIPVTSKIKLYTGLRIEKNNQSLSSYYQGTSTRVDVSRDTLNFFPSANLTYNFNDKNLIRLAYGVSINRPEFREIAPFYFVDFDLNAGIKGNPNIKQSYIHNYELRYEMYPTQGENISIGGFYKNFKTPIEFILNSTSPTQYTFDNVESATSYGLEVDLRKSLENISVLKYFSVTLNASLIKSEVIFDKGLLYRDRPLQGQSPYIVNAGIFYQNQNKGITISTLYNIIGKRITAVGRPSPIKWEYTPDIYEQPRHLIDLSISKEFGKYIEFKFAVKNLLNSSVVYKQNIDTDVDMSYYTGNTTAEIKHFSREQITKSYKPGSYFTFGLTVKI